MNMFFPSCPMASVSQKSGWVNLFGGHKQSLGWAVPGPAARKDGAEAQSTNQPFRAPA